jgi:hypothetical protein
VSESVEFNVRIFIACGCLCNIYNFGVLQVIKKLKVAYIAHGGHRIIVFGLDGVFRWTLYFVLF